MTQLSKAFGAKFNKDNIRIRSFEMGGHTFKVKVPLTAEYEAIIEKSQNISEEKLNKYYDELSAEFIKNKDKFADQEDVVYQENDVLIKGISIRDTAKNKIITENRILEMFKLIVPEVEDFDMKSITYDMIEEEFPFPVQLQMMEEITNVISPTYKAAREK